MEGIIIKIRKLQEKDAREVSALIAATLRTTNIKDYSPEFIENEVKVLQPQSILYDYKNGISTPDAEGLLRLEKFR